MTASSPIPARAALRARLISSLAVSTADTTSFPRCRGSRDLRAFRFGVHAGCRETDEVGCTVGSGAQPQPGPYQLAGFVEPLLRCRDAGQLGNTGLAGMASCLVAPGMLGDRDPAECECHQCWGQGEQDRGQGQRHSGSAQQLPAGAPERFAGA
jgi:hypothetical protein